MVFSLCLENCFRWLLSWNHSLFSQIHPLLIQAIRHNQSTKIAYYAAIPKVLRSYSFGMIIRILSIFWHFFGKMFQKFYWFLAIFCKVAREYLLIFFNRFFVFVCHFFKNYSWIFYQVFNFLGHSRIFRLYAHFFHHSPLL